MTTNLEPSLWGPYFWTTFHFIASGYDNNPNPSIKLTMKNFIQSIPVLLPCRKCQDHAFDFLRCFNLNKVVESRKDLFTFFFNFHNVVNKRLKKPLMLMEDALKKYHIPIDEHHLYLEGLLSKPGSANLTTLSTTIVFILFLMVLLTLFLILK